MDNCLLTSKIAHESAHKERHPRISLHSCLFEPFATILQKKDEPPLGNPSSQEKVSVAFDGQLHPVEVEGFDDVAASVEQSAVAVEEIGCRELFHEGTEVGIFGVDDFFMLRCFGVRGVG